MNRQKTLEYNQIIDAVRSWPAARRISLMRDILNMLSGVDMNGELSQKRNTLPAALGLISTASPPSDDQIKSWLNEQRLEKYG